MVAGMEHPAFHILQKSAFIAAVFSAIGIAATAGARSLLTRRAPAKRRQGDSPRASTGADAIRPLRINVRDGDSSTFTAGAEGSDRDQSVSEEVS
jgi:hypothetical protein